MLADTLTAYVMLQGLECLTRKTSLGGPLSIRSAGAAMIDCTCTLGQKESKICICMMQSHNRQQQRAGSGERIGNGCVPVDADNDTTV